MIPAPLPPEPGWRYGPCCNECRGFYWRIHQVGERWLCNYCRFKSKEV